MTREIEVKREIKKREIEVEREIEVKREIVTKIIGDIQTIRQMKTPRDSVTEGTSSFSFSFLISIDNINKVLS